MSSRELMEKLLLKVNFNFQKTDIYNEVFKKLTLAEYGKNEFDNLNLFTWRMFFKKSKHPDYVNLYLKGPTPANTILRSFKIWKVLPTEQVLLDFEHDSIQNLWKCKKFCHKKSLVSRHKEIEECKILCELELWRSVESTVQQTTDSPSEHLESLFTNGKFYDVTIICDGNEFKAHKYLLMEMSPVFESLLCMDSKSQSKIEFKSMKPLVVREMIQFLYCGKIKKFEFLPDLLLAADNYEISALKNYCRRLMKNKINKDTVLAVLVSAEKLDDNETRMTALAFIRENARDLKSIFTTKSWLQLVEMNSKLAQEITNIVNDQQPGATAPSVSYETTADPPSYDSIASLNQPGSSSGTRNELYPKLHDDFENKTNVK